MIHVVAWLLLFGFAALIVAAGLPEFRERNRAILGAQRGRASKTGL